MGWAFVVSLLRATGGKGWNMVGREEIAHVYISKGDSSPEFDTNEKQINSRTLRQTTSVLKRRVGEGSAGRQK